MKATSVQKSSRTAKPGKPKVVDDGWRIPDALWVQIEPLLPPPEPHPLGCHNPAVDARKAMDAIFFVLRTGCQWGALSQTNLCSKSSAHRWFQRWVEAGVFELIWALGLEEYDDLKGLDWRWQSMDGAMSKAPLGGGKNRSQPHRPGQGRREAQRPDRRERRTHRRGGGRSQCQ